MKVFLQILKLWQWSSVKDWFNRLWFIHIMEYFTTSWKNEEGLCVLVGRGLQEKLKSKGAEHTTEYATIYVKEVEK